MIALLVSLAMAQEPDTVHMDLTQFLALYDASKVRPKPPEPPPRAWAVPSARLEGDVALRDGAPATALIRGRITVENLSGEWVKIPFLPRAAALRSARLGGRDAPVVLEGDAYVLVTKVPGQQVLDVEFALPVTDDKGVSRLSGMLGVAGATELTLSLPSAEQVDFLVNGAQLRDERVVGGRRTVSLGVPVSNNVVLSWQRALPEEAAREARIVAEMTTLVTLGDGVLRAKAVIDENVLFAGVSSLRFSVPEGMTVLGVTGTGLRDWRVADGVLTTSLSWSAEGAVHLVVELERPLPQDLQGLALPVMEPLGVERTRGTVGVAVLGTLQVDAGVATGAVAVDPRGLPALVGLTAQPVLLAWKYLGNDVALPVELAQNGDVEVLVTLLDQADATTMVTEDGRRLTRVHWEVRNNRRQFLRLDMPEGAEVWSAAVAGRPVQPARDAAGQLLLPLIRSDAGTSAAFGVDLVYVENGEADVGVGSGASGRVEARLPIADAPTSYVAWTVYAPTGSKVPAASISGSLRHVDWLSRPVQPTVMAIPSQDGAVMEQAEEVVAHGGLGQGAAPVEVTLPLTGVPVCFEKLLALDEALTVGFDWRVR